MARNFDPTPRSTLSVMVPRRRSFPVVHTHSETRQQSQQNHDDDRYRLTPSFLVPLSTPSASTMSVARSPSTHHSPCQVRPVLPLMNRRELPADGSPAQITTRNGQQHDGVIVTTDIFGQFAQMTRLQEQQGRDLANTQTDLARLQEQQGREREEHRRDREQQGLDREQQGRDREEHRRDLDNANVSWAIHYASLNDRHTTLDNRHTTLDNRVQDLESRSVNCPVCLTALPSMRISCGHMICEICLNRMVELNQDFCPVCRGPLRSSPARTLHFA